MAFNDHAAITCSNVPSAVSANKSKPVVLMVEDHQNARPELKQVLLGNGYSVIVTDNGQEAAQQARHNPPDLLVIDMDVPLLYELVAARQILKNAQVGTLPVLIVTHEGVVDPVPLIEIGASRDEYVTRLSNYAELQPLLDYLLPVLPRTDDAGLRVESKPTAIPLPSILFD
jgi:DNA-binding response OmpR family regulator